MKQFIVISLAILGLTSNTVSYAEEQPKSISSACDDNLFGTWTLVSESTTLVDTPTHECSGILDSSQDS